MILANNDILSLEIELTTLCNAKCPLCYRNYKSFPSRYKVAYSRKLDDVIAQLNQYPKLNYVMLVGSMSEPTLYKDFIQLVQYLKSRKIKIEICTNGDTRNDDFWKQLGLSLSMIDEVYFTICGSTQELHERYRKNTCLKNILHNASVLRAVKPIDIAQCIRFNYNSDDFDSEQFKQLVSQFSKVYWTETFYPKDIDNYVEKFDVSDFIPAKQKLAMYNAIKNYAERKFESNNKGQANCQSLYCKMQQIDVFGNVYPCYLFLEYSNLKTWNQDYSDILKMQHPCCKFCEQRILSICQHKKLDYII